jgi:Fur family transcriptional regulator, ferric uptake regulator
MSDQHENTQSHETNQAQHDEYIARIRAAGYKLTKARLTILDVIEDQGGHVTSAQVIDAVNKRAPDIGRASVFRTLDLLTRLCIVRPTFVDSSQSPSYVLLPQGRHHHIICLSCSRVYEFEQCNVDEMLTELQHEYNVQISGHLLELYGVCAYCQDKAS